MIDFGTSNDNAGSLDWPSGLSLPTTGDFSLAFFGYFDDLSTGTWATVLTGGAQRIIWRLSSGGSWKLQLLYWNGSGYITESAPKPSADTTVRSYLIALDDTAEDAHYFVNGSQQSDPTRSSSGSYDGTAGMSLFEINDYNGQADGASGARGHVCMWNKFITPAEAAQYNAGATMPAYSNLKFWCRMITTTTLDEITGDAPTTVNTPATTESHAIDGYFSGGDYMNWLLYEIFMPFLVGSAGLFGSNLMMKPVPLMRALNKRCGLDWTKEEFHRLTEQFRCRPSFAF